MALIGISDFHYAILTKDDKTGVSYLTVKSVPGLQELNLKPKTDQSVIYGDNQAAETISILSEVDVDISTIDLPLEVRADLLGKTYTGGVLYTKSTDVSPYVAIGYKTLKSNGKSRWAWLYKGQFTEPESGGKTKGDKAEQQAAKITGKFLPRTYDASIKKDIDEESTDYLPTLGDHFFDAVDTTDTTAPTATTVPANNATAVVVSSNVVFTFSKEILSSTAIAANFFLMKNDATIVPTTVSIDSTKKIVTVHPISALTATSTYIAVATENVKDLYGNALANKITTKFTTA